MQQGIPSRAGSHDRKAFLTPSTMDSSSRVAESL
jgi:hypothetical protein